MRLRIMTQKIGCVYGSIVPAVLLSSITVLSHASHKEI